MSSALVFVLFLAVGVAGAIVSQAGPAVGIRELFRAWPSARESFVGGGSWIPFSRRFGWPYAIGSLLIGLVWPMLGGSFIPDTRLGAWLLFGPSFLLIVVGVCLGMLVVARWMVGER